MVMKPTLKSECEKYLI